MRERSSLLENAIRDVPVIGLIRRATVEDARAAARAAVEGGLKALEITLDSPTPGDAIRAAVELVGDRLLVGAGTVRRAAQVELVAEAGGSFVVSPHLSPSVFYAAAGRGLDFLPGVLTPTEVESAIELLSTDRRPPLLKLFPSGPLGPGYVRDLLGPFPEAGFVCTGGLDADSARNFLDAGAFGVALGSALFPPSCRCGAPPEMSMRVRTIVHQLSSP